MTIKNKKTRKQKITRKAVNPPMPPNRTNVDNNPSTSKDNANSESEEQIKAYPIVLTSRTKIPAQFKEKRTNWYKARLQHDGIKSFQGNIDDYQKMIKTLEETRTLIPCQKTSHYK